jgi:hypothetical protein
VGWGLGEEDFDNQQAGSDDDRAIGYVEGGPLILADVEEQEVDHATVEQAVPEISQGSAENQGQADPGGGHGMAVPPQQRRDDDQRNNRKQHQHRDFPLGGRIGEQAERGTAILHMGNAEETGNDLLAIVQRDILCDRPLGGAVEQHHQEGDQEVVPAH